MVQIPKLVPPPTSIASAFPEFNRWLHDLQITISAINTNAGNIDNLLSDITSLQGEFTTLQTQVTTNTANIATNTANIATNTANIATNTANIATLQGQVTALQARNQIRNGNGAPGAGLGNNGDLYLNNTGAPGSFLYGKIAGAWTALA